MLKNTLGHTFNRIFATILWTLFFYTFTIAPCNWWIMQIPVAMADNEGTPPAAAPDDPDDDPEDPEEDPEDEPEEKEDEEERCPGDSDKQGQSGKTKDPVLLYTGAEEFGHLDMELKGLYPIKVTRKYNSQTTYDSPLGYGWAFNFDQRLYEYADDSVVIRFGCGKKNTFIKTGGAYQSPVGGTPGGLVENTDGTFVFTYKTGAQDFYDAQGRLTARENVIGHRHEFTYSNDKYPITGISPYAMDPTAPMTVAYSYRLLQVQERAYDGDLTGNSVTFAYDETTGRVISATASDGRTITYQHAVPGDPAEENLKGNLKWVIGLEGHISQYNYTDPNDAHNITFIQEGAYLPYEFTYDELDRVIGQTHGTLSREFIYAFLSHTTVNTSGINAAGPYTTSNRTWFDPTTNRVRQYEDELGNTFEYGYDPLGFQEQTIIRQNNGTKEEPDLEVLKTITHGMDSTGNKLSESVTLDSGETITKSWTYDHGRVTSEQVVSSLDPEKIFRTEYTYYRNPDNSPWGVYEIKRLRDNGTFQTTTYQYDAKRRIETITLPDGVEQRFSYETGTLFVKTISYWINGEESPYLKYEVLTYDERNNPSSVRDAKGNITQMVYDDLHRITEITNALNEKTILTYQDDQLTQIEKGNTTANGEGQITRFVHNSDNRLWKIESKNDEDAFVTLATYTYDSEGRRLSFTDGERKTWHYEYDPKGLWAKVIDPLLKETSFSYDALGNRTSTIDANLNETVYEYDDLDRMIQVTQQGVTPIITTQLSYDASGNINTVTDGENHTTEYRFDSLLRLMQVDQEMGQSVRYIYDDRDRLDLVYNARGQVIDYEYEEWGPAKTIQYLAAPGATPPEREINFTYDHNGNLEDVTDSVVDTGVQPLYSKAYDALNRLDLEVVNGYPGGPKVFNYNYDRYGNLDQFILGDGAENFDHQYTYNKLNQLTTILLPGNAQPAILEYFNNNALEKLTRPNGITTDYTFFDNGPVASMVTFATSGLSEVLSYTYDNVNNVDTLTETAGMHDYNYDGVNQLTQAIHPAGVNLLTQEDFAYDQAGNREDPADPELYDYDANNRILKSPSQASYQFDDDGNMTNRADGAVMQYDANSRLVGFTKDATQASYVYDSFGRRISKTVNGVTTWYLWSGDRLIAEYDEVGTRQKRYAYAPLNYAPLQMEDTNGIYDVHTDHLDTPRFLTDQAGTIVWNAFYQAYGQAVVYEDVDDNSTSVVFNARLPGQYYDEETGFHYNWHRYYDPSTGRYLRADPIGLAGGINLYGYVSNDPVNFIDPEGLWAAQAIGGAIGAGYGMYSAHQNGTSMLQGALVGGLTGVLSTIPIPGLNGLASGALMGALSGGVGNLAGQATNPCSQGVNMGSLGNSMLAGAAGGALGGGLAGARLNQVSRGPLLNSVRSRPLFTSFGQNTVSATAGGLTAGGLDAGMQ